MNAKQERLFVAAGLAVLASCGPAGDDKPNPSVDVAGCLAMGESSPTYPATYSASKAENEAFEAAAAEFADAYPEISAYRVERRPATITPYIEAPGFDNASVPIADAWSRDDSDASLADFAERWETFFNPYDADLVVLDCDDPMTAYCYDPNPPAARHERAQEICGLPVTQQNNHFYQGSIDIMASWSDGSLIWVQSSVVPQVPLPYGEVGEAEVASIAKGATARGSCGGDIVVAGTECVVALSEPTVTIYEVGEIGEAETIEYRLVQTAQLAEHCDRLARVVVSIDAVTKELLSAWEANGCDG